MSMDDWGRRVFEFFAGMIFFTTTYVIGVEYLGYSGYLAFVSILCASILIVLLIWLKVNNKGIFAFDEEE
jgi:hypothetical protein